MLLCGYHEKLFRNFGPECGYSVVKKLSTRLRKVIFWNKRVTNNIGIIDEN